MTTLPAVRSMTTVWLIVGPPDHGVVILAEQLVGRLDAPVVLRADDCDGLRAHVGNCDADTAHVHFTDRLFGTDCEAAARTYTELATHLGELGVRLAVTMHDLPVDPDDPRRYRRRADAYATVIAATTGAVIVSSDYEADLLAAFCPDARPVVIALPIDAGPSEAALVSTGSEDVTVFGYLYPGKGHRAALEALAGLPPQVGLTVLGRVADGHADLADELHARAAELGRRVTITGWLDADEVRPRLRAAGIPLVGHERMSASGSIGSWLSAGRRPLVPDVPYARELARRCPGAVTTYPPTAAGLSEALTRAHIEPPSTWLALEVTLGPSSEEVARAYRDAVRVTGPVTTRLALPDGRFTVPGNRWDLLAGMTPSRPPSVSVIVAYYDGQQRLDRMLAALAAQTHPQQRLEVIVADDGSPAPPVVRADRGLRVQVVRQEDLGFRAAAARNLGAAAAQGDVLCFLDDDTLPEPGYVAALARLPALAPDALVTGRRRHVDLNALDDAAISAWLSGADRPPGRELPEPQWLRDEHRDSANLLRIGPDSHRYVISAVLACSRVLFHELGGFDAGFDRYGGEDWEFAHRALCAGAVLAHEPAAVAWHDGPSWAERGDPGARRREKNAETAALLGLIPPARGRGPAWTGRPNVVVEIGTGEINIGAEDEAAVIVAVCSVLAGDVDTGVWLQGEPGRAVVERYFSRDPRVQAGPVDDVAGASARVRVTCTRPLRVAITAWAPLLDALGRHGEGDGPGRIVLDTNDGELVMTLSAALGRAARWASSAPSIDSVDELFGRVHLDAGAVGVSPVDRAPDLAHELKHLRDPR